MTLVLPQPEGPTKAAKEPAGMERERFWKVGTSRVGYWKETRSSSIEEPRFEVEGGRSCCVEELLRPRVRRRRMRFALAVAVTMLGAAEKNCPAAIEPWMMATAARVSTGLCNVRIETAFDNWVW